MFMSNLWHERCFRPTIQMLVEHLGLQYLEIKMGSLLRDGNYINYITPLKSNSIFYLVQHENMSCDMVFVSPFVGCNISVDYL